VARGGAVPLPNQRTTSPGLRKRVEGGRLGSELGEQDLRKFISEAQMFPRRAEWEGPKDLREEGQKSLIVLRAKVSPHCGRGKVLGLGKPVTERKGRMLSKIGGGR